jgi:hypothetical protein
MSTTQAAIHDAITLARTHLKDNLGAMRPTDYVAAKKFIDSLDHEANFRAVNRGIAAN